MRGFRSVVLGAVLMATVGAAPAMAQGAKFSLKAFHDTLLGQA